MRAQPPSVPPLAPAPPRALWRYALLPLGPGQAPQNYPPDHPRLRGGSCPITDQHAHRWGVWCQAHLCPWTPRCALGGRFQRAQVSCGAFLDHRARSQMASPDGGVPVLVRVRPPAAAPTRPVRPASACPAAPQVRAQALEVFGGWAPSGAPGSWPLTAALFGAIAGLTMSCWSSWPRSRLTATRAAVRPSAAGPSSFGAGDRPVPLAGYFPDPARRGPRLFVGFFNSISAFSITHLTDIVGVLTRNHRYQISEVARTPKWQPGHRGGRWRVRRPGGPDRGAGHRGRARAAAGPLPVPGRDRRGPARQQPGRLGCDIHIGSAPPPAELPRIAARVGSVLDPVNLQDPAARAWLRGLYAAWCCVPCPGWRQP